MVPRSMISVRIDNLLKTFGDVVALNHVNLTVEPGELFFLLGPSGCGKTTLLRSIAGFYIPDQGKVWFDKEDVTQVPPHKRNTGMMFQSYALWPHKTVAGNVAFGLEERKVGKSEIERRVREALASVRMEHLAHRHINQLSGGQQQRVALARALVIRPRCLLLDEPLSNLDAKLRLEMRTEIRRVCKEFGLTAIYVTHDQKEALSIADRLAILDAGNITQAGTPREIYKNPRTKLVADFIGETNFLEGALLDPAEAIVETSLGKFCGKISDLTWKPQAGEKVILSIRPETWTLHDTDSGSNSIQGKIGDATYLGELAQYLFHSGAHSIRIFELNPQFVNAGGKTLFASVKRDDVVILRS